MISAEELRIGNLVQDEIELETNLIVFELRKGVIVCGDEDFSHHYLAETIKGIPLSIGILKKCGFVEDKSIFDMEAVFYTKEPLDIMFEPKYDLLGGLCKDDKVTVFVGHRILPCNYLHQLQNIYFSLTGSELPVSSLTKF